MCFFLYTSRMAHKNIIAITGNNSFLIDRERRGFIDIFTKKYGEENRVFCSLSNTDAYAEYRDNLLMSGLFSSTRLFVFSWGREKSTKGDGFESILEEILPHLNETDFLLFSHLSPAETGLIGWLKKHASIREKNISWAAKDWEAYMHGSSDMITQVLKYYQDAEKHRDWGDENRFLWHAIAGTITNLALLQEAGISISKTLIQEYSHGYEWAKIFDLIDAILAANPKQALTLFSKISARLDEKQFPIFYGSLVWLLRNALYVIFLRDHGTPLATMTSHFPKMHPFVMKKSYQARIQSHELWIFFQKLIDTSIAYKSGKWMKKSELWRILEIEVALLELKK